MPDRFVRLFSFFFQVRPTLFLAVADIWLQCSASAQVQNRGAVPPCDGRLGPPRDWCRACERTRSGSRSRATMSSRRAKARWSRPISSSNVTFV